MKKNVVILGDDGNPLGCIAFETKENHRFMRQRMYQTLINSMTEVDLDAQEKPPLELLEELKKRIAGYDDLLKTRLREAFPGSDTDTFFEAHTPCEKCEKYDGRLYFLVLCEAILRGMFTALSAPTDTVYQQIDV